MKKLLYLVIAIICFEQVSAQVCFAPPTTFTSSGVGPYSNVCADFNSDGLKDIAVCHNNSSNVAVRLGTGGGNFGAATIFPTGSAPGNIICLDLNNDGKTDIVSENETGHNISVLLGNGTGGFSPATNFSVPNQPRGLAGADLNNDGNMDIAVTIKYNIPGVVDSVRILLGNGSGGFSTAKSYGALATPSSVDIADYNEDGKLDLAMSSSSTTFFAVLLGNGTGGFGAATSFATPANSGQFIISDDFNSDGHKDLALAVNSSNMPIHLGAGNGTFGSATNFPVQAGSAHICKSDFNGDGKTDLAVSNFNANVSVLLGNGVGGFGPTTNIVTGNGPLSSTGGDINNDGKNDLVVVNYSDNTISTLLNMLPYISISGPSAVCANYTPPISLTASGATTYTWSANAGSVTTSTVNVSPSSTTIYSVSGNNPGCAYSGTQSYTVTVNPLPNISFLYYDSLGNPITGYQDGFGNLISGAFTCKGKQIELVASGASTYMWSNGSTGNVTYVAPFTTTIYTVTGTSSSGCVTTTTVGVHVDPPPTVNSPVICAGATATLTASGSSTYTWNTGPVASTITVSPTSSTSYTVTARSVNGCIDLGMGSVTVNSLPIVIASATSTLVCSGISVTLNGSGATTYTWSGGVTDGIPFIPSSTQSYTVWGEDVNGCLNSASKTITVVVPPVPDICMLTADSLALNNIIYWDKTLYPTADSFFVYRFDAGSSQYLKIGAVSKSDSSKWIDTARNVGGPNGGDPQYSSWKYKLAILDTCGNLSAKSLFHQSVFVQENLSNFTWNGYTIETFPSNYNYAFYRDDNNTGSWHVLVNTAGLATTDPAYLSFPNGNWRVDALGFSCTPTFRLGNNGNQSAIVKSKSNIRTNRTTGLNTIFDNRSSKIYPNPSSDELNIQFPSSFHSVSVEIYNAIGENVLIEQGVPQNGKINISGINMGVYEVRVLNKDVVIYQTKLIKQ